MSWLLILVLFLVGVFLSAFFSGSETGFYRASRVRLQLDAMSGNAISRRLLWLTNNPTLFVATTLVGNNLANYLTSAAIVMGMREFFPSGHSTAEVFGPIVLSPFIFVYGELLPKYLFYLSPNRLLHIGGPFFLVFMVLFAPVAAVLWFLGRCLQQLVGEAPENVQLRLVREELKRVFQEGHEAGILRSTQQQLAQGMFTAGNRPVSDSCVPTARFPHVHRNASKQEVMRLARRHRRQTVFVTDPKTRHLEGYIRVVDLYLDENDWNDHVRPLLQVLSFESQISTLIKMQSAKEPVAEVVDQHGATIGIISVRRLTDPLLGRK